MQYPTTPSGGYKDLTELAEGGDGSSAGFSVPTASAAALADDETDPFGTHADVSHAVVKSKEEVEGTELSFDIKAEIDAQRAEFAKTQAERKATSITFGDFEIADLDGDGKVDSTDLLLRQLSGGDNLNTMAKLPPPPPPPHHEQRRQIALAIVRSRREGAVICTHVCAIHK